MLEHGEQILCLLKGNLPLTWSPGFFLDPPEHGVQGGTNEVPLRVRQPLLVVGASRLADREVALCL